MIKVFPELPLSDSSIYNNISAHTESLNCCDPLSITLKMHGAEKCTPIINQDLTAHIKQIDFVTLHRFFPPIIPTNNYM